jgi:hypothetical protein
VTVLIAEAGTTTKVQLIRAARLLERLQIPGMAVVLNKINLRRADRATREDVSAFETRLGSGNAKWNPIRGKGDTSPDDDQSERVAKEDSTYA